MSVTFTGVLAELKVGYEKVKSAVVKAAAEASKVAGIVAADAPEVEAIASLVYPKAGSAIQLGVSVAEKLATVVEAGGTAAESNLLSLSNDQSLVDDVKALIAALKSSSAPPAA